jgi:hypothetical protein
MERCDHGSLGNRRDDAIFRGGRGGDSNPVAVHAAFTEKLAGSHYTDHGLLAVVRQHGELDPAFLDAENRVGAIALREDVLPFLELKDGFAFAHLGKKF